MQAASRSNAIVETWRALSPEQRVAGLGATLLIVSTFGPFSFVEAAIVLVAVAVLVLLRKRSLGADFHLPFGDGTVIAVAGLWCGVLITIRLFDRPLGQNLLALACAAILLAAGVRERAKRPADDTFEERVRRSGRRAQPDDWFAAERPAAGTAATEPLADDDARTQRLDPTTRRLTGREAPDEATTRSLEDGEPPTRPLPDEPPELRLPADGRRRRGRR